MSHAKILVKHCSEFWEKTLEVEWTFEGEESADGVRTLRGEKQQPEL
jgi:hypothetical protein